MRHRDPSCLYFYSSSLILKPHERFAKWGLLYPPYYWHCLRRQDSYVFPTGTSGGYMGDIGGAAQAAASVTDTAMTDTLNAYEANKNRTFNADQAALQRTFSADQAQKGRDFASAQQIQAEQYNTDMSNTAIQRRVSDLKTAGLNPLLAAGQLGGASAPQMSAPTPSSGGSGAAASSSSMPQFSSFTQGLANLNLTNAQAARQRSETPTPRYVNVETEPDGTQSITVNANAGHELGDQALASAQASIAMINSTINKNASEISLNDALSTLRGLDSKLLASTLDGLVKAQNANNALSATLANSGQRVLQTNVMGQNLGVWIEAARMIIGASQGR